MEQLFRKVKAVAIVWKSGFKPYLLTAFWLVLSACSNPLGPSSSIESAFNPGFPFSATASSTAVTSPTVISGQSVQVKLTIKDDTGEAMSNKGLDVSFYLYDGTSTGSFSAVIDNGDGTYTSTFTGAADGTATAIRTLINGTLAQATRPTIQVLAVPPAGFNYTLNPAVYTRGLAIVADTPIISGGAISSFSISPALPPGLSLNTTTGVITGTPSAIAPTAIYTVTANNSGGSTTAALSITVNDVAPSSLTYATNPAVYTVGSAILMNTPSSSGGAVTSYSVSPALPAGLALSATTGAISGTPTAISATAAYIVTASNTGGSTTASVSITVNDVAPSALTYSLNPAVYTRGSAITANVPSSSGGAVTSYSVSPTLPAGLALSMTTGVISGTPTAITPAATYTITATNSGGSTNVSLSLTVNDVAPSSLTYSSNPATYTVGGAILMNTPSSSGGAVVSYSVSPALPAGLAMSTSTGHISGTPTAIAATASYIVTASNSGGSTTAAVSITVNDVAPSSLSYSSNPATYTKGGAILMNTPTASGGAITSYSVSPALPTGLSLNPSSGAISGTPTAIASTASYTITAVNTGGSATVAVSITVNDVAPSSLAYSTTPATYTKNTAITANSPSASGGAIVSYAVSPALPAGLSISTSTGVISGTPTSITATASYTVTATNTGGSATVSVSITVNDNAPSSLSYATNPATYTKSTAITSNSPSASGGTIATYSVSPALPAGLSINTSTGVISGTPTAITSTAAYTITAANTGGSTTASVSITVNDVAPSSLNYSDNTATYTKGSAISANAPSVSGGAVTSYSVSPILPAGLSINTSTGVIAGTPTAITSTAIYTITATNSGGSTTAAVSITVNDVAPSALTYSTNPATYTKNTAIAANSPSASGGTITSYSVSPTLPAGLSINTSTGVISGTPTSITATATYTVTASNTGGSTTVGVSIAVNAVAPSSLTYATNPATYVKGTAITTNSASNSGGTITLYGVSPTLPAGLSLNTLTGDITGTPTGVTSTASYTITGTNSGGSTTMSLSITVNDVPPSSLTYSTNPAIYVKGTAITSNTASASGGTIISYSVSPALPAGLSLSTSTGTISGTPTTVTANASYTITATNSGGSTTVSLSITVNDIAPSALTYTGSPYTFTRGTAITSKTATNSGGTITGCSSSPTLPTGLAISATCVISGTPTVTATTATYTITATNTGGSTSTTISILVNDAAPIIAFSGSPFTFTRGTAITTQTPSNTGGAITGCSTGTALPVGLSLSTACVISGTPTAISGATSYTITASNVTGTSAATIFITVNDIAPSGLTYSTNPATYSLNTAITSNTPSTSGGGPVVSYSVSPALPAGLSLNTTTGTISGTPTANSAAASYTITATNTGGSTTVSLSITVNSGPPVLSSVSNRVFPSSAITAGVAMTAMTFVNTVTGDNNGMTYACTFDKVIDGAVASGTACTSLPGAATFSTSTGTFNWTPTTAAWGAYEFSVVGTNAYGSSTKIFVIDIFAGYPTTNLVMDYDANYAAVSKVASNSPMTTTWTNLSSGGVTYDATLTSFPATGLTTNGWSGAGTVVSPNALTMNASGSRVAVGTGINSNSQLMFSTWISPASIAATTTGAVIATNNNNGTGTGFTLKQSDRAVGTIELEALAASTSYAYQNEVLSIGASNLIGYWRLGEASGTTMVDASGNGNTGNYYVGATLTAPTFSQTGALLGDSDTAVKFANTGTGSSSVVWPLPAGPQVFSSEAWFKTTAGYASGGIIVSYGKSRNGASSNYDRKFWMDNTGKINGGIYNGSATRIISTTAAYNDGKWHHAVLTFTAGDLRLYVDGIQIGQLTATVANAENFAGYWRIGYESTGSWAPAPTSATFLGTIDEVAVYKVVLTPAQVLSHYQVGMRRCIATTVFANNAFKNVSATFDGQYTKVYVNGVQQCSVNYGAGATLAGATGSLTLGGTSTGTNSWTGSMSEFRIYSSGTATDVTNIYNATSPRY